MYTSSIGTLYTAMCNFSTNPTMTPECILLVYAHPCVTAGWTPPTLTLTTPVCSSVSEPCTSHSKALHSREKGYIFVWGTSTQRNKRKQASTFGIQPEPQLLGSSHRVSNHDSIRGHYSTKYAQATTKERTRECCESCVNDALLANETRPGKNKNSGGGATILMT